MLGKRNRRARAFSNCHATVLAGFILLAYALGMGSRDHGPRLSEFGTVAPFKQSDLDRCSPANEMDDTLESCAFLIKVTIDGAATGTAVILRFGVRL